MDIQRKARAKILTFLVLTFSFSSIFYYLILSAGSLYQGGGLYIFGIMWCPGLAGLLTQLIFEKSLRGLGWGWGKSRYQFMSYLLPLLYALLAYGVVWLTGLGGFPNWDFVNQIANQFASNGAPPDRVLLIYILIMLTLGMLQSMITATGEEIGWRGLLVPEMHKIFGFTRTALLTGLIWAAWHSPILIFGDYNSGTPVWFGLTCFTLMVIGISFVMAWLRLKSGSLWTGVILHASHNMFIQSIFTPLTTDTGITAYIIDEFGVALVIPILLLAYLFWRKRGELPEAEQKPNPAATVLVG